MRGTERLWNPAKCRRKRAVMERFILSSKFGYVNSWPSNKKFPMPFHFVEHPKVAQVFKTDAKIGKALERYKPIAIEGEVVSVVPAADAPLLNHGEAVYHVEFDANGLYTLAQLDAEGFFYSEENETGWDEFTRDEIQNLPVGESRNFGGGAAPVGTIKRVW